MKKLSLVLVLAILVGGGIAVWAAYKNDTKSPTVAIKSTKTTDTTSAACKAFTLSDAKQILGASAVATTPTPSTSTSAADVSNCIYGNGSTSADSIQTASILVRKPKDQVGITTNSSEFSSQRPAGVQNVQGYGDAAFWSAQYGQLNVLKNSTWVILSVGPANPTSHTLAQTEQLANIVVPQL